MNRQATLQAYAGVFSAFSPEALERLDDLCRDDIAFRDPFHETRGLGAMRAIFAAMFALFDAPRFTVHDTALGERYGFVFWSFDDGARSAMPLLFEGTSTLEFDEEGRIASHADHWDAAAAIHGRLPLLGPAIRLINARIAAKVQARKD
ncbi:MAG: nuclear transport factor 2 family protein [Proteobacteria bacterium]|nr:nuclear transport factor 2 family protein [Pseudomonadota bacterium]